MLLRVFGTFILLVSSSFASMSKKKFQLPPSSSSSSEEAGEAAPLDHPLMLNLSSPPLSNDQLKFKPHTEWEISYKEGVMYRGFKSDQGMSWWNAYFFCKGLGGGMELAKVKSQGQTEMLGKIIDQAEIDVWLGGNDLFVEGKFHWDLGTKEPFEYTNWYGSEPNNMHNEDCLSAYHGPWNYTWNDKHCDLYFGKMKAVVCQIELPKEDGPTTTKPPPGDSTIW